MQTLSVRLVSIPCLRITLAANKTKQDLPAVVAPSTMFGVLQAKVAVADSLGQVASLDYFGSYQRGRFLVPTPGTLHERNIPLLTQSVIGSSHELPAPHEAISDSDKTQVICLQPGIFLQSLRERRILNFCSLLPRDSRILFLGTWVITTFWAFLTSLFFLFYCPPQQPSSLYNCTRASHPSTSFFLWATVSKQVWRSH